MKRWWLLPVVACAVAAFALDVDNDGMSDIWQELHGVASGSGNLDWDGDGFTNLQECAGATDPWNRDSHPRIRLVSDTALGELNVIVPTENAIDYDVESSTELTGWTQLSSLEGDGEEQSAVVSVDDSRAFFRLNIPPGPDQDGDGLSKWEEVQLGTSDYATDSDGDGLSDVQELEFGCDPSKRDSDDDGLSDGAEVELGYDPSNPDSNNNGTDDGDEDLDADGVPNRDDAQPSVVDNMWVVWTANGSVTVPLSGGPGDGWTFQDHGSSGASFNNGLLTFGNSWGSYTLNRGNGTMHVTVVKAEWESPPEAPVRLSSAEAKDYLAVGSGPMSLLRFSGSGWETETECASDVDLSIEELTGTFELGSGLAEINVHAVDPTGRTISGSSQGPLKLVSPYVTGNGSHQIVRWTSGGNISVQPDGCMEDGPGIDGWLYFKSIWHGPATLSGSTLTFGASGGFYSVDLCSKYEEEMVFNEAFRLIVVKADLDIDSDSNNGSDTPERSETEESKEEDPTSPGKLIVFSPSADADSDGVPDFADGITNAGNITGVGPLWNLGNHTAGPETAPLIPLVLQVEGGADSVTFSYDASDPRGNSIQVTGNESVGYQFAPASGSMRIWRTNGTRNATAVGQNGGDYIPQDTPIFLQYLYGQEPHSSGNYGTITLYIEPIGAGANRTIAVSATGSVESTTMSIPVDTAKVSLVAVDLAVDTDRDGIVDPASDKFGEDLWDQKRGAIYAVNLDADGNRTVGGENRPDAIHFTDNGTASDEDWTIDSVSDQEDIAPLVVKSMDGLPGDYKVILKVEEAEDLRAIHIFPAIKNGTNANRTWGSYGNPSEAPWVPNDANPDDLEIDISTWVNPNAALYNETRTPAGAGDYVLGIEGLVLAGMTVPDGSLAGAPGKFSGEIALTVEVRDSGNMVLASDKVRLRVAPWLAISAQGAAQSLYIANHTDNSDTRTGLADCGILASITLPVAEGGEWWFQDHVEIGYTQRPGGPPLQLIFRLPYYVATPQPTWPLTLLGPGVGAFQIGNDAALGWTPGDWGGNLEILPPAGNQTLGRIIMGNMVSEGMKEFLRAQGEHLQVSDDSFGVVSDWLKVGHIDEYAAFLPRDDQGHRVVLIADSRLAIELLEDEQSIPADQRHLRVFFAGDPSAQVLAGQVTANATGNVIQVALDSVSGNQITFSGEAYLRFYEGEAKGQVARVMFDSANGTAVVLEEPVVGQAARWALWNTGDTFADYQEKVFSENGQSPLSNWVRAPLMNDRFVLVQGSLRWNPWVAGGNVIAAGMPAIITVEELLSDTEFRDINYRLVQEQLDLAAGKITAASGDEPIQFVPVPALWFGAYDATNDTVSGGVAFNPGPTNLQVVAGTAYVPRQFAPLNSASPPTDIFESMIAGSVSLECRFLDSWNYHRKDGEIHCATATKRESPTEHPWWVAP
jgi:hypothetical protein